jgi:hypothetical protein
MNIVMGAKVKDITSLPELLSMPLAYSGVDEDSYVDKLPLLIRFAQLHLTNLQTAKNPKDFIFLKNYRDDSKELLKKNLLVKENDLAEECNSIEKIKKEYAGEVQIVSSDEIIKAIEEKTPNTAVLHQIGPAEDENKGRSYRLIFGTDDAKMYYFNYQDINEKRPNGMLLKDFKFIQKKWF